MDLPELPVPVDPKQVNATLENGLLSIALSETASGDGATIPIRAE